MTKYEYLAKLERALGRLPENERRDILSDYEEHFRVGAEMGQSDDEICRRLGDPDTIAAEYQKDKSSDTGNVTNNYTCDSNDVKSIYVSADAAAIDISTSPDIGNIQYRLKYKLTGDPNKVPKLELNQQGENVYITLYYNDVALSLLHVSSIKVEIVVPQNYSGRLFIKSNAGKIDVLGGIYDLLSVKANASRIQTQKLECNIECDINSSSAKFNFLHFANYANVKANASSVSLGLPADTNSRVNYTGELSSYKNYFDNAPYGDIGNGGASVVNIGGNFSRFVIAKI